MIIVVSRVAEYAIASIAGRCGTARIDRLGMQDKKPHIAVLAVGCFASLFWNFPHIADHEREVRLLELSSDFSADRTSWARTP